MTRPSPKVHLLCLCHVPIVEWLYGVCWEGVENAPASGPAILCPNHASYYDPSVVQYPIYFDRGRRLVRYLAMERKVEGARGWFMRAYDTILTTPGKMNVRVYREMRGTLREGGLLGVFPEGQRTWDGRLQRFQPGAARLAIESARRWSRSRSTAPGEPGRGRARTPT